MKEDSCGGYDKSISQYNQFALMVRRPRLTPCYTNSSRKPTEIATHLLFFNEFITKAIHITQKLSNMILESSIYFHDFL